ncbi:histone methyltransferase [Mycena floridula]|nr:histone methyltransferase [Mycena floridula]
MAKVENSSHSPSPAPSSSSTNDSPSTPLPLPSSKRKLPENPVQLIGHLPVARAEALSSFNEIEANCYQYKSLGLSRELLESMACDCTFEPGIDRPDEACGHGSDCINRLTQVECLPEDCRCKSYCQNQRFQKRAYAPIQIVKTEMKGYGLRAEEAIRKDSFIYEYVGDVVSNQSFKKRMRDYAEEGIEHFYFMMLQKEEFIDATKNGGIGRFANHSCNPNCYVAKWSIGAYVRMGIFAKRNIVKDEELTFNYNVDRYGQLTVSSHQAQTCYCGEPNCVGFIGGKTQTDISTMDDLYLDALGITDEHDLMELKGTKKKKGKKIDDPDFMASPQMHPLLLKDVPKVVQAIRQTQSRKVLLKLLLRIKLTNDETSLREIMRLRGYSLMKNVLEDHKEDFDMVMLTLECMLTWPLLVRNKVDDSQILGVVESCLAMGNEGVKVPAQKLLDHWATLAVGYRIPKRSQNSSTAFRELLKDRRAEAQVPKPPPTPVPRMPIVWREPPPPLVVMSQEIVLDRTSLKPEARQKQDLIIAAVAAKRELDAAAAALAASEADAKKAAAEASAAAAAALKEERRKRRAESGTKKKRKPRPVETEEQKQANKEKRLLKLVAAVVVKCMSKHAKVMDREMLKKHAQELTHIIAEKEKKSATFKEGRLDSLSDEKVVKIKKFAKEYIEKILYKLKKAKKRASTSAAQATPDSTLMDTPDSADAGPSTMMTVEEAMDMDLDDDSESEGEDPNDAARTPGTSLSPSKGSLEKEYRTDWMEVDLPPVTELASDPRRRPPNF